MSAQRVMGLILCSTTIERLHKEVVSRMAPFRTEEAVQQPETVLGESWLLPETDTFLYRRVFSQVLIACRHETWTIGHFAHARSKGGHGQAWWEREWWKREE